MFPWIFLQQFSINHPLLIRRTLSELLVIRRRQLLLSVLGLWSWDSASRKYISQNHCNSSASFFVVSSISCYLLCRDFHDVVVAPDFSSSLVSSSRQHFLMPLSAPVQKSPWAECMAHRRDVSSDICKLRLSSIKSAPYIYNDDDDTKNILGNITSKMRTQWHFSAKYYKFELRPRVNRNTRMDWIIIKHYKNCN